MADKTTIEWTDATWNVVNGCSVTSPGCKHCYAMKQAHRVDCRRGLTEKTAGGMVWTGEVRFNEKVLDQPLRWREPRRIFVCAHGDLFHENVPDGWIDRVFAVMALCPQHTFQVLTKRAARMRKYCSNLRNDDARWFAALQSVRTGEGSFALQDAHDRLDDMGVLRNVWLGVSVEDQARADERIPDLLATPAAMRWLSCEPLLGPVMLDRLPTKDGWRDVLSGDYHTGPAVICGEPGDPTINWVIVGGESGPKARPMHPDWARSLRDQCAAAGVPFLFKQWGAWAPLQKARPATCGNAAWPDGTVGLGESDDRGGKGEAMYIATKALAGRMLDGVQHDGFPT